MGLRQKIKLGDIVLDAVVKETSTRTAQITDRPVEKGLNISDHLKTSPYQLNLSGSVVDDAPSKLQTLIEYQKEAKLLEYHGRNLVHDVVITQLNTDHPQTNANGFDFDITIRFVKISKPETFEINVKNPDTGKQDAKTATKVKTKSNAGRKQPKSTSTKTTKQTQSTSTQTKNTKPSPFKDQDFLNKTAAAIVPNNKAIDGFIAELEFKSSMTELKNKLSASRNTKHKSKGGG